MNLLKTMSAAVLMFLASTAAYAGGDALLLRIQDAMGTPGGEAVISMRTYASRPVGQGQICFSVRNALRGGQSLGDIKDFRVYGANDDVDQSIVVTRNVDNMTVMLQFSSPSASINAIDGPLAAIFLMVNPALPVDLEVAVELDLANTFMVDGNGLPIPIETRDGRFRMRHPAAPFAVSADSDQNLQGGPVRMSFQTTEPFDIGAGQVAIRYNSRMFPGGPRLIVDDRYGFVATKLDAHPGLAVFRIVAVDNTFNDLPGDILSFLVDPHAAMGGGIKGGVVIDEALTALWHPDGTLVPMSVETSSIVLE